MYPKVVEERARSTSEMLRRARRQETQRAESLDRMVNQ